MRDSITNVLATRLQHIIIDEVHERSIESDFLLIILKTLTAVRKDLKVILMSATVDAERISAYCGGCPTISVPGRTFPVDVRYLEDAVELTDYTLDDGSQYARRPKRSARPTPNNKAQLKSAENDDAPNMDSDDEDRTGTNNASAGLSRTYRPKTIATLDKMDEYAINHELIVRLLERVCFSQDLHHYSAATLIFLPGLADIRKCHDLLSDHEVFGGNDFRLYPLHSSITSENQGAVFNIPPPGIRKIVMGEEAERSGCGEGTEC